MDFFSWMVLIFLAFIGYQLEKIRETVQGWEQRQERQEDALV